MAFSELLEAFRNRRELHNSEATARRYVSHVESWQERLENEHGIGVLEAETDHLRAYIEALNREEYAPSSIQQQVSAISKFYQDIDVESDLLEIDPPENPYEGLDEDTRDLLRGKTKTEEGTLGTDTWVYLQPEEVARLVENVPAPQLRNVLIVKLLYNCGFRRRELTRIKLEHVTREDRQIYIPGEHTKTGESRVVEWNEDYLGFEMNQWIEHGRASQTYARESEYLLPTNRGEHISHSRVGRIVKAAAESAGLQESVARYVGGRELSKVTAHTLRHSYAMQLLKSGVNVRTIQQMLGHKRIETTQKYLQQSTEDRLAEARKFEP